MKHFAIREGDEFYCPKCAKRWGVGETPPPCESKRRMEYLIYITEKFLLAPKGTK